MGDFTSSAKPDPGWNDPPMLSYSSNNPPPKSRITNKRVAFPMYSGNSPVPGTTGAVSATLPPVQLIGSDTKHTSDNWNSQLHLEEMNSNLSKIYSTMSPLDQEMLSKLEMMKEMWSGGQLDINCQQKVWNIIKLVVEKDYDNAEQLKQQMITECESQCQHWLISLNYLIENYKH